MVSAFEGMSNLLMAQSLCIMERAFHCKNRLEMQALSPEEVLGVDPGVVQDQDPKPLPNLSDGDISMAKLFNQLPAISHVPHLPTGTYTAPILLAS